MTETQSNSVTHLAELVRSGARSAVSLAEEALAKADAQSDLGCFLSLNDNALDQAKRIDDARSAGAPMGPLAGVPVGIKDALCTLDAPTTAGSKILTRDRATHAQGFRPAYDATVVSRLREAGAVLLGKTNMDEFAMGSSNENSAFGPVKNPWDPTRIPGGSSGGSAACVAAGIVPASLGSDTGGSIRQPASHCGVVGVKPSYGRVSRYGLIAFASSLDQVGPLTADVKSAARILEVIAGPCPKDATCADSSVGRFEAACDEPVKGLRVGLPEEYFGDGLDPEVKHAIDQVVEALKDAGCSIKPVSLPHTKYGISTYYVLATAEASSNLSRFDGVRFGYRSSAPGSLQDMMVATRAEGFGDEVKRRIMLGTYALSSGYYDAYYLKAQQVRALIRKDFDTAFTEVDLMLTPSAPTAAFELGEKKQDPLQMYLADVYTLPASLAGICGLSVPAALTSNRLPIGVQLLAPAFEESRLFSVAAAWERVSPVRDARP